MAEGTERKFVSLTDIAGEDVEMEGFDPNANAYAGPPPVKPGNYVASLSFASNNPEEHWEAKPYNADKYPERAGTNYYNTRLVATILDGEYEGRKVFSDNFMGTGIFGNKGTSNVASLLRELGYDLSNVRKQTQLMELLEQALAGEPTIGIFVDAEWRGSAENLDENGYRKSVRGVRNFPKGPDGEPLMAWEDDVTGETIAARPFIAGYRAR